MDMYKNLVGAIGIGAVLASGMVATKTAYAQEQPNVRVWFTEELAPGQTSSTGGSLYSQGKMSELTLRPAGLGSLVQAIGSDNYSRLTSNQVENRSGFPRKDWGDKSEQRYLEWKGKRNAEWVNNTFWQICDKLQYASMPEVNVCDYETKRKEEGRTTGNIVRMRIMNLGNK